jgi:hypothetical protein
VESVFGLEFIDNIETDVKQFPRKPKSWTKEFIEVFLPAGYPNSVSEDYLKYVICYSMLPYHRLWIMYSKMGSKAQLQKLEMKC